jgi:hypothetical protein
MATLLRFPFKLVWYRNHSAQLYDLSWDAGERSDLAAVQPELAVRLRDELVAQLGAPAFSTARRGPRSS